MAFQAICEDQARITACSTRRWQATLGMQRLDHAGQRLVAIAGG
jgi:hypothetical protein